VSVATPSANEFLADRMIAASRQPAEPERAAEILGAVARQVFGDRTLATMKPSTPSEWADLAFAPVPEANRQYILRRLIGKLLSLGVDPEFALALLQAWNLVHCRPPLPPDEVDYQVRYVTRLHAEELERRG
jgi:hypothetical protein